MELDFILKNVSTEDKVEFSAILESFLKDDIINDSEAEYLKEEAKRIGIDYDQLMAYLKEDISRRTQEKEKSKNAQNELFKLADIFLNNGELSDTERKILSKKAETCGVSDIELRDYINAKTKGRIEKNSVPSDKLRTSALKSIQTPQTSVPTPHTSISKQKKSKKTWVNYGSIFPTIVILACIIFLIYNKFHNDKLYSGPIPIPLDEYIQNNPKFIFQEASLRKYLSYGTPSKTSDLLERLTSFQVKATGKFSFDMENITINKKTDEKHRKLVLDFNSNYFFPISVDVDIQQEDIVEVDRIEPKEIPDSLAKKIASYVAVPAAIAGGILGTEMTSTISCWLGKKAGVGAKTAGALAGSIAIGTTGYIFTSKFLAGLKLSSGIGVEETEEFLFASKQLIAAELLNMNYSSEKEKMLLRDKYESIISQNLTNIALFYGWETVDVKYHYN